MNKPGKLTELLFDVGMIVKGIDSAFEVVGGILLAQPTKLARYIVAFSQHEAFRHHDFLAGKLDNLADKVTMHPNHTQAIYLMVHGLAKMILIGAIVAGKRWGYIGLMVVLSIFTTIEVVQAVIAREVLTGIFGLFDLMVVVLIYREFKARFPKTEID